MPALSRSGHVREPVEPAQAFHARGYRAWDLTASTLSGGRSLPGPRITTGVAGVETVHAPRDARLSVTGWGEGGARRWSACAPAPAGLRPPMYCP
jgi:hypothetical protein